jgi:hypothetical protein
MQSANFMIDFIQSSKKQFVAATVTDDFGCSDAISLSKVATCDDGVNAVGTVSGSVEV